MKYYIGLDVSMKTTSICIVNADGKVMWQNTVDTDPKAIFDEVKKVRLDIENIALESGSISNWLLRELKKHHLPVICIDSRKMSKVLSININKTDKNDARMIAEALRCNFYSEVHEKTEEQRDLSIILGGRRKLIDTKNSIKNTIRGHLKAYGIRLETFANDKKFVAKVQSLFNTMNSMVVTSLTSLLAVFETVTNQIIALEMEIEKLCRANEQAKLLVTIPGVGMITALTFLAFIGNPHRFKNSRAVGAYFGMTPKQNSSGETIQYGRVSKCGNSEMRSLLVESAMSCLYRTKSFSRVKSWGLRIKKKRGGKKAVIAVARKHAVIMHRMLITMKPFEYGEPKLKKAPLTAVAA